MSMPDSSAWTPTSYHNPQSHSSYSEEENLATSVTPPNGIARSTIAVQGKLHWPRVPGHEILGEIGSGAMGIVYKALHVELRRTVALKMLRGVALSDPAFRERFRAEAAAVARLQHPNIIQVFEIGTAAALPGERDPSLFISLEFVDGGSLARHAARPQCPKYAASIVEKLARATHYAHQSGVIHRDLKPANVLMTRDEEPKIADFGVAKQLDEEGGEASGCYTMAGTVIGTPQYMAPEQAAGASPTTAMDIYALGVILYELITARVPFQGSTSVETLDLVRHQEPVSPRRLNPELPSDLETICLKCLEKLPAQRYGSALELAEDLRRYQEDRPIRARRIGEVERWRRWCRRNPALAATSAGFVCVFAVAFMLVTRSYLRAEDALWEEARQRHEAQRNERAERWERYRANLGATAAAIQLHNIGSALRTLEAAPEEYRNWEWRHFQSRVDSAQHVVSVCEPWATKGIITRDASRLMMAGDQGRAGVWSTTDRTEVRSYRDRPELWHALISPDGRTMVQMDSEHCLSLRDVDTDRVRAVLRGHTRPIHTLAFTADSSRLLSAAEDNSIRIWDAKSGSQLRMIDSFKKGAKGFSFSQNGRLATLNREDSSDPELWNLQDVSMIAVLKGHALAPASVQFNLRGDRIVTAERYPGLAIRIWDATNGRLLNTSRAHTNSITCFEFSADQSLMATASLDQTIGLWDIGTGKQLSTFRGHSGWVNSVAFSLDGRHLVSGSQDRTVRLWDVSTGEQLVILHGHSSEVFNVAFAADGSQIISTSRDGTARFWDAQLVERNGVIRGHKGFVYHVAFFPDGERVASASWDGTVKIWNLATGRQLLSLFHGEKMVVSAVAIHPNGKLLASRARDAVRLWDLDTGRELHRFGVPSDFWRDTRLAFSPKGNLLAAGCENCEIRLWDVDQRKEVGRLVGHTDQIRDVTFSPDGSWIASASDNCDRSILIWDVTTQTAVRTLRGHVHGTYALAFHPDGHLLASGATDGTIRLWDVATGQEVAVLKIGSNAYGVAFTPDGSRVVGACADNAIRFWDTSTHQEVAELRGHEAYVHAISFSPDGTRLASASGDLTVRIWDTIRAHDRLAVGK